MKDERRVIRSVFLRWTFSVALVGVSLGARPEPARAQAGATNKAGAEALFDEGRRLMSTKDYAQACKKFEESQQYDEGIGTLLYLADCYEQLGRTASAWATFREAASRAHAGAELEREKVATRHATALEPRLARLSVRVDPRSDAPGLELRRDGQPFDRALWTVSIPLDPGPHTIEASAPGKKSWKGSIDLAPSQTAVAVVPPLIEDASVLVAVGPSSNPGASSSSSAPPEGPPASSSLRTIGYVLGGIGIVGVGAGAGFGLAAKHKNDEADAHCQRPGGLCDGQGVAAGNDVASLATIANFAVGAGVVALVVGGIMVLTAPSSRPGPRALAFSPEIGAAGGSLVVSGTWQ